jgi:RNA polymerase-binding transcription factor
MDKAKIHELLKSEIAKTGEQISRYEDLARPISPDNAIGRVSRMDAINNKSIVDAALRKAKERLVGLKLGLDKLESGDFGICRKCKNNIPIERILLTPQSSFCVNCAR